MDNIVAPDQLDALGGMVWLWGVEFLPRIGGALLIFVLGYVAANWVGRAVGGLAARASHLDPTLRPVISSVFRYAIIILVVVVALGQLGVQTASILAVLGAAGLAIGLALQGTLSNIAAGLMLIWLRPFRVGDYIETPSVAGTVREIGLFVTHLDTFDGMFRFVPNSELWNKPLTNYNRNAVRMFNVMIGIPLDADLDKARATAMAVLEDEERVMDQPKPRVFLDSAADNFLYLGLRAWIRGHHFWMTHRDLSAALKARLAKEGITIQRLSHAAPDIGAPWADVREFREKPRAVAPEDVRRVAARTGG